MQLTFRAAVAGDSEALTHLSFAAKGYWNYPPEYFAVWRDELTITPEYIAKNIVQVAECAGRVVGYFSLTEVAADFWAGQVYVRQGHWLEHIFVLPEYIGQGVGSRLMAELKAHCLVRNIARLYIFTDPNARVFYDKLGARFLEESPSSIPGRTVPLYELDIT
jgi:GNAT superfamily N-acetyltransferase